MNILMKNKSAVSQILTYLENNKDFNIEDLVKSCKNMLVIEKEQIIDAFEAGMNDSVDYYIPSMIENKLCESEQYYEETYEQ